MRSLRSFLATTSRAPSSILLRPIFQASAARIENCSMVSGSVVGTISTATWLPLRVSRSLSFCVSDEMSPADNVPVWSTTRPDSGGTATSASATKAQHTRSARKDALAEAIIASQLRQLGLLRWCRRGVEIHFRRGRDFLFVVDREIRLLLVSEHHPGQVVRG